MSCSTLNRLFAIHYRSLAQYLSWSAPHRARGDEGAWAAIQLVVAQQKEYSARIVELIAERGCRIDYGDFPITFTGSHDLDLAFLIRRLVQFQKGTIAALEEVSRSLADDPVGQSLADECLGAAKGHLESLEEAVSAKAHPVDVPAPEVKLHEPAGH